MNIILNIHNLDTNTTGNTAGKTVAIEDNLYYQIIMIINKGAEGQSFPKIEHKKIPSTVIVDGSRCLIRK